MNDASAGPNPVLQKIEALVLFDGECNLCNGAVQFIIARDPNAYFKFAPLQSELGQTTILAHGLAPANSPRATMVLVENGRAAFRSEAALRIARKLGTTGLRRLFWRSVGTLASLIPPPIRNVAYDWVARNRRHWFGREQVCWVPTPDLRRRFID